MEQSSFIQNLKKCVCASIYVIMVLVPWNCLQHSVAYAFLAILYSDYMLTSKTENLYYQLTMNVSKFLFFKFQDTHILLFFCNLRRRYLKNKVIP